jgi:hypothetical protein
MERVAAVAALVSEDRLRQIVHLVRRQHGTDCKGGEHGDENVERSDGDRSDPFPVEARKSRGVSLVLLITYYD